MIKSYLIALALIFSGLNYSDNQIAQAICQAENSVKYPYGIKSVNTYGNVELAKRICLNTIRNNRVRFLRQSREGDFIKFLGKRYCPVGTAQWVKNVKYFLNKR